MFSKLLYWKVAGITGNFARTIGQILIVLLMFCPIRDVVFKNGLFFPERSGKFHGFGSFFP